MYIITTYKTVNVQLNRCKYVHTEADCIDKSRLIHVANLKKVIFTVHTHFKYISTYVQTIMIQTKRISTIVIFCWKQFYTLTFVHNCFFETSQPTSSFTDKISGKKGAIYKLPDNDLRYLNNKPGLPHPHISLVIHLLHAYNLLKCTCTPIPHLRQKEAVKYSQVASQPLQPVSINQLACLWSDQYTWSLW